MGRTPITFTINNLLLSELETCVAALDSVKATVTVNQPVAETAIEQPAAPAPAAPAPAAPAPTATMTVDSRGVPYNEAIHSGGAADKRTKADGSWKKKKGVDQIEVDRIEKESMDLTNIPACLDKRVDVMTPPNLPTAPAPTAPAPTAPAPAATPASTAPAGLSAYDAMMVQVTATLQDPNNPIQATHLPQLCAAYQIASLPDAINSPDIIAAIHQHLLNGTVPTVPCA